ncbi:FAD-binding oxidoreductase [Tepidanaerobacter syntrophicus]|uniref:FAD-binding oxidoreductase n=1 Tax=Tepidanaerobacter syntrophicus TaxID=224999 RepID=UPI001BD5AE51|nr:FAD-binding oxidoreductase [Tepidanaerobacter syntrophicus]
MSQELIYQIDEKYKEYLSDESRMTGVADSISFPKEENEIIKIITRLKKSNTPITIQGGKTGIVGCAVPIKGHVLNLSNMNHIKDFIKSAGGEYFIKVEPGVSLLELNKEINMLENKEELFWPPDPTEPSATIGGIASCNAKGICSYAYGDTKKYIDQIRVVQSDGIIRDIKRGEELISFANSKIDLIDVYLGGEGMFGLITELTLKLKPKPKFIWGIAFFFKYKEDIFTFAESLITSNLQSQESYIAAIEYIDRETIDIIEKRKKFMSKLQSVPDIEPENTGMIYIEIHGDKEESIETIAEKLMELAISNNSDPDKAWALSGDIEVEKVRNFRHAAPESVNAFIEEMHQQDFRITKLGTDMSVKNENFSSILTKYETDVKNENLKSCIFGHLLENHLHVNILPKNYEEYKRGITLIEKWAEYISLKNGRVVTENGVGKLKKSLFLKATPPKYIDEIRKIKCMLDPEGIWNPGNMI